MSSAVEYPVWKAHASCPDNLRFIIEQTVNSYPREWLQAPVTGEIYASIDDCRDRINAYAFSQGFDAIILHSTQKPTPSATSTLAAIPARGLNHTMSS